MNSSQLNKQEQLIDQDLLGPSGKNINAYTVSNGMFDVSERTRLKVPSVIHKEQEMPTQTVNTTSSKILLPIIAGICQDKLGRVCHSRENT